MSSMRIAKAQPSRPTPDARRLPRQRDEVRRDRDTERIVDTTVRSAMDSIASGVPDISAVVAPSMKLLAPLVGHAVGAFLCTTLGMMLLGVVLAGGAFVSAARVSARHGLLAAVVVTCAVLGGTACATSSPDAWTRCCASASRAAHAR